MTDTQWLVLDNLKRHWPYHTNLDREQAEQAYLWCVRNEYIRDGQLTDVGRVALLAQPTERKML